MDSPEMEQKAPDHQDGTTEPLGNNPCEQLRVSRRQAIRLLGLGVLGITIVGCSAERDDSPMMVRGGLYKEQFDNEEKIKGLQTRNREIDIRLEELEGPELRRLSMEMKQSDIEKKIKELQRQHRNIANFLEEGMK